MTVKFIQEDYGNTKEILMFPDHYVAHAHTFLKDDAAAATVDGKKIIKAGTIYPSNDAKAVGVVLYDVDVTNGDESGAIVVHGFVNAKKIPAQPAAAALAALNMIKFYNATNAPITQVANGGTGAANATDAKTNLEIA